MGTLDEDSSPTDVTLTAFDAEWDDASAAVVVTWETAAELNTLGFNLWRSVGDRAFAQVNASLIPVQNPGGVMGGVYEFVDIGVTSSEKYTYKLEAVEVDGARNWYGPLTLSSDAPTAVTNVAIAVQGGAFVVLLLLALLGGGVYVRTQRGKRCD